MNLRSLLTITLAVCTFIGARGQSVILPKKNGELKSGVVMGKGDTRPIGANAEMKLPAVEHGRFSDTELKDLEKKMEERDWGSEDTAWERACSLNTKEAYQRYIAIYPNGAHRADATCRLIDIDINNIFNGEHNDLPAAERVQKDDNSPTSTILVQNDTDYPLTVLYSGKEIKKIQVSPGSRVAVTLQNGFYRIAASVPPARIKPYAGSQTFEGGRYQTGYCIVSSGGFGFWQ